MIPIPINIIKQLQDHLLLECTYAQSGWEFANQDEDTLTGDFFGKLNSSWKETGQFRWRFHYNKIRGRGKDALEKKVGADGIITLHYQDDMMGHDYYKSLVFQAKKESNRINQVQWDKMNLYFPKGNIIVSYGPNGYFCYLDEQSSKKKLCDTIAYNFLKCTIGIEGLYYDHSFNKFIRPNNSSFFGTVSNELLIDVYKNP